MNVKFETDVLTKVQIMVVGCNLEMNLFCKEIDFSLNLLSPSFSATVKAVVPQGDFNKVIRNKVTTKTTVQQETQKHVELFLSNAASRLKKKRH